MLTREEVLKIARLARLELTAAEVELYQKQLGRVLGYVHELNNLTPGNDSFVRHVPKDAVSLREDRAVANADSRALMANAPSEEDHHFLLPTIVERS